LIGAVIVGILFLKYLLKAMVTVPVSPNIGNITPHIMAFKVGALLLYPTFIEYIDYCSGFMFADFFWLNRYFGSILADNRERQPASFSVFYTNMNIASMYLLPLGILAILGLLGFVVSQTCASEHSARVKAFFVFLYNFFVFGVAFAGCASLQGAIMNPITSLNVNGAFYIIGILLYFCLVS
jgi:hypothetical protein